jgi:hypothetical protein
MLLTGYQFYQKLGGYGPLRRHCGMHPLTPLTGAAADIGTYSSPARRRQPCEFIGGATMMSLTLVGVYGV